MVMNEQSYRTLILKVLAELPATNDSPADFNTLLFETKLDPNILDKQLQVLEKSGSIIKKNSSYYVFS